MKNDYVINANLREEHVHIKKDFSIKHTVKFTFGDCVRILLRREITIKTHFHKKK